MKTSHIKDKKSAELRQKTEAKHKPVLIPIEKLSDDEVRKLANKLQIKQIELEKQNDELRRTQKEREDLSLLAAREYAEYIIETARKPLIVLDSRLCVITANKPFYKTFVVSPQDTLGKLIYELGNREWNIPRLRQLLEENLPDKGKIVDYMIVHDFESLGKKVFLLNAQHIINGREESKLILLCMEDITEQINIDEKFNRVLLKSWEHKRNLQAIFKSVKDGIIIVDSELRILEFNDLAREICGFPDIESARGKKFQSFIKGCSGVCLEDIFETAKKKLPAERRRFECFKNDKRKTLVSITSYPICDNQEQFNGCVIVLRDETRLASLEGELHEPRRLHNIIGKSVTIQKVFSMIEILSDKPTTVLITGESGTGKRLVAEALHDYGKKSANIPYVVISCSSLSDSILESELFGHVKGAFTGAISDRVGRFQKAEGGTIFLDEIGDISDTMQLRLLRILEEKVFERVGDSKTIKANVRIITATNQNLRRRVHEGKFREDLYHRLKVVEIAIPPLRNRREDIPLLVEHFIEKLNVRLNKQIKSVCPNVLKIFMDYKWPGNIRELYNTMEYAFTTSNENMITVNNLPYEFENIKFDKKLRKGTDEITDRLQILQALEKTGWNKAKASRLLGIHRATIYKKMKQLDITEEEERPQ
ncbi:MAG: sigma-54-dependent Fis family transcriptional regulator [Candidatus Scalindua rubra]|uniref:Transcriptional regulator n=1 Tax=Candidatus Scalindua brodae TaxID=237368 RepID=A0A0B0ELM0_9BACT|nr:MAG: transcriptional regulator [Candidatus Scalindua brodae]MBZ0107729.1 sigma-54-dependent Fis family transcriptional regulator [Candidatus Scalindua rubra]TWU35513.1 Transcriptional regulatory protein ZraR [Candidatus Brocadiaceae bacterium S225]